MIFGPIVGLGLHEFHCPPKFLDAESVRIGEGGTGICKTDFLCRYPEIALTGAKVKIMK